MQLEYALFHHVAHPEAGRALFNAESLGEFPPKHIALAGDEVVAHLEMMSDRTFFSPEMKRRMRFESVSGRGWEPNMQGDPTFYPQCCGYHGKIVLPKVGNFGYGVMITGLRHEEGGCHQHMLAPAEHINAALVFPSLKAVKVAALYAWHHATAGVTPSPLQGMRFVGVPERHKFNHARYSLPPLDHRVWDNSIFHDNSLRPPPPPPEPHPGKPFTIMIDLGGGKSLKIEGACA